MSNINKVFLSGNLTRDPELKTTPAGLSVLQLGIAVNGRRKNAQTGQWEDVPNYFNMTMFGTRAEKVAQLVSKGTKVAVEGQLRWRQWTDGNGQNRNATEVLVDEIEVMARPRQEQYQDYADEPIPF